MSKWEMVRLGDIFHTIRNGASIKQNENSKGIPITRIETISNGLINKDKLGYADINDDKYEEYYLQHGDILMSHINSEKHLGKVAIYASNSDEKIIHGMNLLCLKTNIYDEKFAYYYFKSNLFLNQIPRITKKSVNQASFTVTALKELNAPLPPLEEQIKIANELDKINTLIEKRKAQIEKLNLLVKAKFVEMFGAPVENQYKSNTVKLGECCILNPNKSEIKLYDTKLSTSFIGMAVVSTQGNLDLTNTISIEDAYKKFTYFADNDVIFAKITPCMENGKGAVVKNL
ncbi:MAG: restriction endonuclease subunit S, partial [Mangrovibacterium sp.]